MTGEKSGEEESEVIIPRTDEEIRMFIVEHYGANAAEFDGRIFTENCQIIFGWIKTGLVPATKSARVKTVQAA